MNRKLDAAIAEALGYDTETSPFHRAGPAEFTPNKEWKSSPKRAMSNKKTKIPYFTEDGNAMMELNEEMLQRQWYLSGMQYSPLNDRWVAEYSSLRDGALVKAAGNTEQKAKARAAYKALTGEEWEGVEGDDS